MAFIPAFSVNAWQPMHCLVSYTWDFQEPANNPETTADEGDGFETTADEGDGFEYPSV